MYDERFVTPMRQELTRLGVEELRTAAEVDAKLKDSHGTTLVVVNSVCGCAARNARPAVAKALQHSVTPAVKTTVFAGQDREATDRARSYFTGYAPSSPSIGLLRDGKLVFMLERYQIEGRSSDDIARDLVGAFDRYCGGGAAAGGQEPSRDQKPQKSQLPQAAVPSPS
jgi:putative YphP/YqiW family bacilliredoxin